MSPRALDDLLEHAVSDEAPVPPELRPLVETARTLGRTFALVPRARADLRARTAALAAFEAAETGEADRRKARARSSGRRLLTRALVAVLVVLLIPSAALAAAWPTVKRSLPGETLYPLKLGVERARLALAFGDDELDVYLDIADARLDEAERAQEAGETDALDEALRRYDEAVLAFDATAANVGGVPGRLGRQAQQAFAHHLVVLASLRDRVPAVAVPGVEMALELAQRHLPPRPISPPGGKPAQVPKGSTGGPPGALPTPPVRGAGPPPGAGGPPSTAGPPPDGG